MRLQFEEKSFMANYGNASENVIFMNNRQKLKNVRITRHKSRLIFCEEVIAVKEICLY